MYGYVYGYCGYEWVGIDGKGGRSGPDDLPPPPPDMLDRTHQQRLNNAAGTCMGMCMGIVGMSG